MADKFKIYTKDYQSSSEMNVTQYLGVDYYTPQLSVADYHAIDSKNFCYRGGAIQVRGGFTQLFDLKGLSNNGSYEVNGIYTLNGKTIMHIGEHLFEVGNIGKDKSFKDITLAIIKDSSNNAYTIANHRSYGFNKGNKLFIIDGTKYRVLYTESEKYVLKNVEDYKNTYVPTTTIGIMAQQTGVSSRQVLDDVNLMTPFRKNKIRTGSANKVDESGDTFTYELDAAINTKNNDDNAYKDVVISITQSVVSYS